MTDVTDHVHNDPRSGTPEHRRHDRLLIARFAAGDVPAADQRQAQAAIEACRECAVLDRDLRRLAVAARGLPVPARPRDFRLSAEQAAMLRGNAFDRFLRGLGAPGMGYLRPLAAAALSLGLVLAAVGSLPLNLGAAMPARAPTMVAPQPTEGPAMPAATAADVPAEDGGYGGEADIERALSATGRMDAAGADQTADEGDQPASEDFDRAYLEAIPEDEMDSALTAESGDPMRPLLVTGGLALAVIGLGMLVVVTLGRRRANDPLLR